LKQLLVFFTIYGWGKQHNWRQWSNPDIWNTNMTNPIRTTVQKYRTQVLAHGQDIFESAINCEFLRGMDDYGNG
jgi:hypothetical protein